MRSFSPPTHPKRVLSEGTLTSVWPARDPLGCTWKIAWHLSPPPHPPRESASPDFIGLVIPSATASHAATHWVTETMRATDTDIISGVIRAARLLPHVSEDRPSPWGDPFGDTSSATGWQNCKGGQSFHLKGGVTTKVKNQEGFFLIIIISSSISDWRLKDGFWSVQRWCQGII